MATVEITKDTFEEVVQNNPFVVIDFWAEWCGPCRRFAPIFERASEKHTDVVFGKVDTEAQPELAMAFEIRSIPTLMVVRESAIIFQQPGALSEDMLNQVLDQARAVDAEEIRAAVASHKH